MLKQLLLNGLISGSIYALVALGFAIIYRTVRFFHFAHAIVFTSGPYFTFLFKNVFLIPIYLSIPLAIISSTFLGCLLDISIYRPLRQKKASSMILLLASLGIYIVLQNLLSMVFGDDTKSICISKILEGINIFGARITSIQIAIICITIILLLSIVIWMKKTKMGKLVRTVSNDAELADISGIDSDKVILSTFAIGSSLASVAGILVAFDVAMTPTMGFDALMMGVIAVIIGGIGSISGIALGALLLGLAQNLGVWYINSQWQDAIAFAIMLIFLLFRPQGFFGKPLKKAEI